MNEHIVDEWIESSKKEARFGFFQKYPLDYRVSRLFAVACCREVWDELIDERSKKAVETAELYADGLASKDELEKAYDDAWNACNINSAAAAAYITAAFITTGATAAYVASAAAWTFGETSEHNMANYEQRQGFILAQMYPVNFDDNWITPTAKTLAKQIYDKKDFSLMPILTDALQDVDCNEKILNYLRSTGSLYKGNYIIDRLIGKRQ